jgi:hypothetical protein
VHALVEYQDLGWNEKGNKVSPPHPKGISGGGAWVVPDSFAGRAVYLDGIAIEYHQQESLVFSDVNGTSRLAYFANCMSGCN